MIFSKSFGYALRGVLYVALLQDEKEKVQIREIAARLAIPRHFLAKIMKTLVKEGILSSTKGPYGGFCANEKTRDTTLAELSLITNNNKEQNICALRFRKCSSTNPCPLHDQIQEMQRNQQSLMEGTTIGELLQKDKNIFIRSITSI